MQQSIIKNIICCSVTDITRLVVVIKLLSLSLRFIIKTIERPRKILKKK